MNEQIFWLSDGMGTFAITLGQLASFYEFAVIPSGRVWSITTQYQSVRWE